MGYESSSDRHLGLHSGMRSRPQLLHAEIFVGGHSGEESVGSLPWSANARTQRRDGVQNFKSYKIDKIEQQMVRCMHFRSLRAWLEAGETSFAHGQALQQRPAAQA